MRLILLSAIVTVFFFTTDSAYAAVVINELLPDPSSGNTEFVEIYNSGDQPVDLSGWTIEDANTITKASTLLNFGSEATISAKEYQSFSLSTKLNNNGDTVYLLDSSQGQVDSKSYGSSPGKGISIGRYPDGLDTWVSLQKPTPSGTNTTGNPVPSPSPSPSPTPPPPSPSPSPTPSPISSTVTTKTITTTHPKTTSASQSLKLTPEPESLSDSEEDSAEDQEDDAGQILGQTIEREGEDSATEATTSAFSLVKGGFLSWILAGSGALLLLAAGVPFILKKHPLKKARASFPKTSITDSNSDSSDLL